MDPATGAATNVIVAEPEDARAGAQRLADPLLAVDFDGFCRQHFA